MQTNREELEQQLRQQAEEAIQRMLDDLPESHKVTMSDMEKATGVMGEVIMQHTLQCLVETQQTAPLDEVRCEKCHVRMSRRGKRKRQFVTVRGEVEVERQYYVCPKCGAGYFPPRRTVGLE
jgi:Zn finger protein HypA/HybF involved in hydrogenase expression